ncbi:MAG: ferredoxin [Acidimicrobiia bacterium]|nr:ferredoxin [Acidimicrobiia bacterium]
MRVVVDHDVCEANAVCESIVPELFHVTDDDVLEILRPEVPPELRERAEQAVLRCPRRALRLEG